VTPRSDSAETPPCDDPPGSSATPLLAIPTPPALRNRASSGGEYWAIRTTPATRPRDGTPTHRQIARELSRTAGTPSLKDVRRYLPGSLDWLARMALLEG